MCPDQIKPGALPQEVLAKLLDTAMHRLGLTAAKAARVAKAKKLPHLSARNIQAYRNGERKRLPKGVMVRALASVVGEDPDVWEEQVCGHQEFGTVFPEDYIIEEQKTLRADDEVWIISCRKFLEVVLPALADLVRSNLEKGVVYKYFFPSARVTASPHGDEAVSSYAEFYESALLKHSFPKTPKIVCFAVSASKFSYFSRLHTLVHYRYANRTGKPDKAYAYIELRGATGEPVRKWYPLPPRTWSEIVSQLNQSVEPIANSELKQHQSVNPQLNKVRSDYLAWFDHKANASCYARLRANIAHDEGLCVRRIKTELFRANLGQAADVKYLDVGCGDGTITAQLAAALVAKGTAVEVTYLDPSAFQLELAKKTCDSAGAQFAQGTLEDFPRGEQYHFITAIHSLYTVDDAYFPKLYELLRPGGIACIWIGALEGNVVNGLSHAFDNERRPGQRRNYGEDVIRILELYGLGVGGNLNSERMRTRWIATPVDEVGRLDQNGKALVSFCALASGNVTDAMEKFALTVFERTTPKQRAKLPITDHLIVFRRQAQ